MSSRSGAFGEESSKEFAGLRTGGQGQLGQLPENQVLVTRKRPHGLGLAACRLRPLESESNRHVAKSDARASQRCKAGV